MRTPWIAHVLLCGLALIHSPAKEDAAPGDRLWEISVQGRIVATAASDEQRLYVGTTSRSSEAPTSQLHCLAQEDGSTIWSQPFPNWLLASPVVTATRLFIGCNDTNLYCLDKATGEVVWQFDTAGRIDSTPAVDTPGNCYFGSRDRFLYALDPQGQLRWSRFLKGPIASSPLIDEKENRLYIADHANTIYAFTLEGESVWSYKPRLPDIQGLRLRIYSSPTIDKEGYLYVGSGDHHVYAVDRSSGLLFWREDTEAIVDASPVISADEFLYIANRNGTLLCYNIEPLANEREVWRNEAIGQVFYGSPTVDALNNIYICGAPPLEDPETETPRTQLSYIDRFNGEILWSALVDGYTDAAPLLDPEGNVYFGTAAGTFVKFRGAGHALADTSWPSFRGQPSGHGRYEETFSQWLTKFGIPPELAVTDRDSDEDGFRDYEEFVFGSHPQSNSDTPDRALPAFSYARGEGASLATCLGKGIRAPFTIQESLDLSSWNPIAVPPEQLHFEDLGEHWRLEAALTELPLQPARFLRVFWENR